MTIGYNGRVGYASPNFFGGKSKDALVDAGYGALPTGWSHTDVGTQPCVSVLIDGAHATGPVRGLTTSLSSAATYGLLGWFNLSGTPSLAFCLAGRAADGATCLECGTDGKVRLVKLGDAPNRWSGRTAVSGWSSAALPLTGNTFKHVAWFMDAATLGLDHCWMTLMIDEVEQWSLDIGAMPVQAMFELCPDIDDVNAAISVRMYDCAGLLGATTDAPHLVAWPKAKVTAQHPIDDYADNWTGVGDLSDLYKNWDDAAGNDGDTTYNWTNTTDKQQVGHGETAATIGIDADTIIRSYQAAARGPVANIVHKTSGAGTKWDGYTYFALATSVALPAPGTSYIGALHVLTRSSGSWAIADVDAIRFGLQTGPAGGAGHDMKWHATSIMLQWLTYLTTLPLTTTPTLPAGGFVQTGMF